MRRMGPFQLVALAGKSRLTMAWRIHDQRQGASHSPRLLVMPRTQPPDAAAVQAWEQRVRRAARLRHPHLAEVVDVGVVERWPYVLYDAAGMELLDEPITLPPPGAAEVAQWMADALTGLAYAHDGGVVHGDVQPYMLLRDEQGQVRWVGLEVAEAAGAPTKLPAAHHIDALQLYRLRDAARADLLGVGLLMHQLLCGQAPLDEADFGVVVERMPPAGRELVRLPWETPRPVPEVLRAIANRATDRQPRQRYGSARAMARALEGWLQAEGRAGGGPLALLRDRLHSAGTLPGSPGSAARAARLALMDKERTNELAEVVLQDVALSFELLRGVNSAQVRGSQPAGGAAILTVRRAIAMIGLDGVRRAALGLRAWPGPLPEDSAKTLGRLLGTARRTGQLAQALRPAGYDGEVVLMVTLLQLLGRLVAAYHFPDEWQQIQRLMQPAPPELPGEAEQPGMSEQAASFAVLGADIEGLGAAVARYWGLDDSVLHLIRRMPLATLPRSIDNDDDMLRAVASCAIELIDGQSADEARREAALRQVAQRYGRPLKMSLRDFRDALAGVRPGAAAAKVAAASQEQSENRA
ncbi:MAG: HDOD domain-containing protein [Burkholderiales bacterium]|nr:HDOD domain-containing protein [Burkholderiales bacterium]